MIELAKVVNWRRRWRWWSCNGEVEVVKMMNYKEEEVLWWMWCITRRRCGRW